MMKKSKIESGFTLIELVVVVTIIGILSVIILFATTQYLNKGKDSNISGNLAILIPAGEAFYNATGGSYSGFCTSDVVDNAEDQMPVRSGTSVCANPPQVCCKVDASNQAWAACSQEYTNPTKAFCVDSRGVKKDILLSACTATLTQCPN